jgi:hypothetical protein
MEQVSQPGSQKEGDSQTCIRNEEHKRLQVPRKPVPIRAPEETLLKGPIDSSSEFSKDVPDHLMKRLESLDLDSKTPVLPPRSYPSIDTAAPTVNNTLACKDSNKTTATVISLSAGTSAPNTVLSSASSLSTVSDYTQKAYREIRHFAGGLIRHPSQSTKHFSILRHSHGLVFYQGPTTSLAISIFADAPLPADRTIWLQSKGWTGQAGMRARALAGWNGSWIDVTPLTRVDVEQLNPSDERAWQRDIASFLKRTAGSVAAKHKLRETAIIRIPVEAGDGYYRLVLCAGEKKKVLCPSPVFRLLSTSTKPASIRGASLSTLPLEIGVKVLSSTARASAKTGIGNTVAPIAAAVQQQIQPYKPSWATQTAARAVYDLSGLAKRVDSNVQDANQMYDQKRSEALGTASFEDLPDDGPKPPFPIDFVGCVDYRSNIAEQFDVPITYLTAVPEDILCRLDGYYFGWVRNHSQTNSEKQATIEREGEWHKAVVFVIPYDLAKLYQARIAEIGKESLAIYIVQDDEEPILLDMQVEVQIMGFIRPSDQLPDQQSKEKMDTDKVQAEVAMLSAINDIEIAQAFLDRPAWIPRSTTAETKSSKPGTLENVKTSYADTRLSLERQIGRLPLHKAGIRSRSDKWREATIDAGGMYVIR